MYINQLDEIFDTTLDKFNKYLEKKKIIEKIIKDSNFVKYQNIIISTIKDFTDTIEMSSINKIVNDKINCKKIFEIIKRYLAYYLLLDLAYNYSAGRDLFITNMIELSKNQKMSSFQISNFFNSENNAKVIIFFTIIKNIKVLATAKTIDKVKILLINNPIQYDSTIKLFNSLGEDYIIEHFLIKENKHNIIKTLIFRKLYLTEEKEDVFRILSYKEEEEGEYKYINVTISKKDKMIDYDTIEKTLTIEQRQKGLALDIYDYLKSHKEILEFEEFNNENKMNILFESEILIPISQDFMRFHDNKISHAKEFEPTQRREERESTKIKEITNDISKVINYYSESMKKNPKLKIKIKEELFDKNLEHKETILYNDLEELKVIKKIIETGTQGENDLLVDLINHRKYSYINYKDFNNSGIKIRPRKSVQAIRSVNLSKRKNNTPLELRMGNNILDLSMTGVAFNPSKKSLDCFKKQDLICVKDITNESNGYEGFIKLIEMYRRDKLKKDKIYYWLFDETNDKPILNKYQNISSLNKGENFKIMLSNFYDIWIKLIHDNISKILQKNKNLSLWNLNKIFDYYKNYENIDFDNVIKVKSTIETEFVLKNLNDKEITIDEAENRIPGKGKDIFKLPVYKNEKQRKNIVILKKETEDDTIIDVTETPSICNHNIKWVNISKVNRKNIDEFNQKLFDFVKQYVKINKDGEYICKSCSEYLPIKKYVYEGTYVKELDTFMTTNIAVRDGLENVKKYEKLKKSIKNINKIIEKIAYISNLDQIVGNDPIVKLKRNMMIKDIMDLLLLHTKYIQKQGKERINKVEKLYKIDKNFTSLFFFDLRDEIFITSSDDTDYYKVIKYNNIIAYLLFILITELNAGQILNLKDDKRCNYFFYDKVGRNLFKGIYLRLNEKDIIDISKLDLLCYVIFYFSCVFTKEKIWLWKSEDNKFNPNIQRSIITTVIDLINSVIEANLEKDKKLLYEILTTRFQIKINNIYKSDDVMNKIKKRIDKRIKINEQTKKISFISKKFKEKLLKGKITDYELFENREKYCNTEIKKLEKIDINKKIKPEEFNILTNCQKGTFHKWVIKDDLVCSLCGKKYKDLLKNIKDSNVNYIDDTIKKLIYINLNKMAIKYCLDGKGDKFNISKESCKKVETNKNWVFSDVELKKFYKSINNNKNNQNFKQIENLRNKTKVNREKTMKINKILEKLNKKYKKEMKNNFKVYVDSFIDILMDTLGKSIKINDVNIPLKDSLYQVDHNYLGVQVDTINYIFDNKKNINIENNHSYFKKDVIYYVNKQNNFSVFYDKVTLQYLGYAKNNKDFFPIRNTTNLKKIYSVRDMILLLGLENEFTNITHLNLKYKDKKLEKINTNEIYNKIYIKRIHNISNIILRIQSTIQKLRYKRTKNISNNKIIDEFITKIKKMNVRNEENKKSVFKNWYIISSVLLKGDIKINSENIKSHYIDNRYLNYLLGNDIKLIFYLISQLKKLLRYNKKSNYYTEIVNLTTNIIYDVFIKNYKPLNHIDLIRFDYLMIYDNPYVDESLKVIGYYNELMTEEEINNPETMDKEYNANEENNAIDVDDMGSDDDFYYEEGDGSYFE